MRAFPLDSLKIHRDADTETLKKKKWEIPNVTIKNTQTHKCWICVMVHLGPEFCFPQLWPNKCFLEVHTQEMTAIPLFFCC